MVVHRADPVSSLHILSIILSLRKKRSNSHPLLWVPNIMKGRHIIRTASTVESIYMNSVEEEEGGEDAVAVEQGQIEGTALEVRVCCFVFDSSTIT